ncbi:MAG: hypothetical protein V4673_03845 [Pseudomonadota bacterium]
MMLPNAKANPPVVRDADADPLFQRGQAKRRDSESTCDSSMAHASKKVAKQDGVGKPERLDKSERPGKSERLDKSERIEESKINGEYPPLKKGGRGDLLFGHHSPAKSCMTHAAQNIGRR